MNSAVRLVKQLLIVIIILGVFGFAGFRIANNIHPPTPTPTPDPRASLAPLEILEIDLLPVGNLDYDVVAKIKNPNAGYGSGDVRYQLRLFFDATGGTESYEERDGSFYILPGQTGYYVISPVRSNRIFTRAEIRVVSVDWQQLTALAAQQVSLVVSGTQLIPASAKFLGTVVNTSDFDISQADVTVILFNTAQHPIAANRTEIRTFLAKTSRGFEVSWSSPIPGVASNSYVEATTNLFENSTFLRTYGTPGDPRQF